MRIITPYGKTKRESQFADNGFNVRKNSTGSLFTRRTFNLIEGSNVTITVADDDVDDEIDVTVAALGSVSMGDAFGTIAVGGEDNVVADSASDTVTFAGLGGVAITTDAASDQVTFSLAGGITGTGLTMSSGYLLGRTTAGTGGIEEIEVGTGLALSAGVLSATGGSSADSFGTIVVAGQSDVVADAAGDTVTLRAVSQGGVKITTYAPDDEVLFALDLHGMSASNPSLADFVGGSLASNSSSVRFGVERVLALNPPPPCGRLSIDSSEPVNTATTSSTTMYYHPYVGNTITLWDGTRWVTVTFSSTSLALGTMTASRGYDVFAYLNSGVLALESLVWTSATARATAITMQDGRYCKSGDKTRLYLGSFYSNSTTVTSDVRNESTSGYGRCVWNMYNRVDLPAWFGATTDSWTYTTSSFRQWPNNAAESSRFNFFRGLAEEPVLMIFNPMANQSTARCGIGLDSTTTSSAQLMAPSAGYMMQAVYTGIPSIGYHYLAPLEYGVGSATWWGDGGSPTVWQCGWHGRVRG